MSDRSDGGVMDTGILKPGHKVMTVDGRQAEILEVTRGGATVRLAYLGESSSPFGLLQHTEEATVGIENVTALLGAAPPLGWDDEVTIVLHYVPESENGPAEYRAETLSGVPNNVVVHGGAENSARGALNHLLGGLALMGFRGTALVDDTSGESFERYEVRVTE